MKFFLREYYILQLVAIERGDVENHLHLRMIARAMTKSARSFGVLVKKYMK